MDLPTDYLDKFRPRDRKSGEPRSGRDAMLDMFLARLNASRIHDGFPKLTYARLAKMLEGMSDTDMYRLYGDCEHAQSFGKLFTWKLKQRKA